MSARMPCGRLGGVASGEGDGILLGELEEAAKEVVNPALREVGGNGEREERGVGGAAHGGDVAESAGEAAVADGVGGMPFAAEVDAFEGEVGGDEGLGAAGEIEDGAVVSDAESRVCRRCFGSAADAVDEGELGEGHGIRVRSVGRCQETQHHHGTTAKVDEKTTRPGLAWMRTLREEHNTPLLRACHWERR